jgi:nucleoside-diphosphate-sugar epimerase
MASALIGHSGFVGGNLARQYQFDTFFNSRNIDEIGGRWFDLLVVSAMPAAMWIANRDPAADRAVLDRLVGCLEQVQAGRVVIMSTIAVYPHPIGVDENSPIDAAAQTAYGRHRLMLEQAIAKRFPRVLAVRLPGIFGPGLKKNVVFDLLHGNELHKINSAGVYQYYNLDRLWKDVSVALASELSVVNFATEPFSVAEMAKEAFGIDFSNDPGGAPARFNMLSRYAGLFDGRDGYLYNRQQVLDDLRSFVQQQRAAQTSA